MRIKVRHIQTKINVVVSKTARQTRANQRLLRRFQIGKKPVHA